MKNLRLATTLAITNIALASGCVTHIKPYTHKVRAYKPDTYAAADAARTPGSLWSEGAHSLFEDAKARRVGDIITVIVVEQADANRSGNTTLKHEGQTSAGVPSFFAAMADLARRNPGLDPSSLIAATTTNNFNGGGSTTQSGGVNAVLPTRIKETMPNGDFYIEGNKVLLLNNEESFLYLSGVVRPIDITPENTVSSAVLADVELEYTGRGVLSESENVGWFKRILNWIWPF